MGLNVPKKQRPQGPKCNFYEENQAQQWTCRYTWYCRGRRQYAQHVVGPIWDVHAICAGISTQIIRKRNQTGVADNVHLRTRSAICPRESRPSSPLVYCSNRTGIKGLAFEDGRKLARRQLTSTRRKKSTEAGKDLRQGKRNLHHQRRREATSTTAVV